MLSAELTGKITEAQVIGFNARNVKHGFVDPVIKIAKTHFSCASDAMIQKTNSLPSMTVMPTKTSKLTISQCFFKGCDVSKNVP